MSEKRNIELDVNHTGGRVVVAGKDVSMLVVGGEFRFRVGEVPRLDLDLLAIDVSEVRADAEVRYLFNGVEFTEGDVRRAKGVGLHGLGTKLAHALGIDYDSVEP